MTTHTYPLRTVAKTLVCAALLTAAGVSQAKVRGCTGWLTVDYRNGFERAIEITGSGEDTLANKARREARDRIFSCFNAQWAARWSLQGATDTVYLPADCQTHNISGFSQYEVDIKKAIERAACAEFSDDIAENSGIYVTVKKRSLPFDSACNAEQVLTNYFVKPSVCGNN